MADDWKDYIKFQKPSGVKDKTDMLDFVNEHFVPHEPLNCAVNLCEPGYR